MKHTTKVKMPFRIRAEVELEVEFDSNTGQAEILGGGRVVSYEDTVSKRNLLEDLDFSDIDRLALFHLLQSGEIPKPKEGEMIMVNDNEEEFFADDWEKAPEGYVSHHRRRRSLKRI